MSDLVRLEAYIDDSASEVGDRRLFLAGYINTADQWAGFCDAWREALAQPPAILYLKMAEAQNLRGQFRSWTAEARDAKVLALARLIPRFGCWSVHSSVSRNEHQEILADASPFPLKAPYFLVWWNLIDATLRYHASAPVRDIPKTHFTFDEQDGVSDDAIIWYEWLKAKDPTIAPFFGDQPRFCDDKDVPQLQAADMLAWHVRRLHERSSDEDREAFSLVVQSGRHVFRDIEKETLVTLAKGFRRVPGLAATQTKAQWREARKAAQALQAMGVGPPPTGWLYLQRLAVRARLKKMFERLRLRLQRRLRRRKGS